MSLRLLGTIVTVYGFLGVALGAFGAHGLRKKFAALEDLETRLSWWQTAVHYHLIHTVVLLAMLAMTHKFTERPTLFAASFWSFAVGIAVFSGSLYVMTLTGARFLGAITPIGGLALLTGWALLFVVFCRT